jgi:UrcA family protein
MQLSHFIVTVGLGVVTAAGAAAADGMRIPVGDLGQRDGAIAFDHRLTQVENRFCHARYRPLELVAIAACEKAVRAEAMDQLTPAQRDAFAAALRPAALASR